VKDVTIVEAKQRNEASNPAFAHHTLANASGWRRTPSPPVSNLMMIENVGPPRG
jgi:hypothetical protein